MLSNSLSTSGKIARLYSVCPKLAEFCRCLFPLMVAHADDWGRLQGDEQTVKLKVDPISPRKLPDFVAALHVMHEVGLITWYVVGDRKVIEIVKFGEHQDLKGHTCDPKRQSKLPACPGPEALIGRNRRTDARGPSGEFGGLSKEKGTELNGTEGNRTQGGESGGGGLVQIANAEPSLATTPDRFETFWLAYPKKKSKDAARVAFEKRKVSAELLATMLASIARLKQTRDWQKDGGQFIPYPASWLNAGGWNDEAVVDVPQVAKSTDRLLQAGREFLES